MRKDAKLGMVIGCILVGVVATYLLFGSSKKNHHGGELVLDVPAGEEGAQGKDPDPAVADAGSDAAKSADGGADATGAQGVKAVPGERATARAAKPADPAAEDKSAEKSAGNAGDPWTLLLNSDTTVSRTPGHLLPPAPGPAPKELAMIDPTRGTPIGADGSRLGSVLPPHASDAATGTATGSGNGSGTGNGATPDSASLPHSAGVGGTRDLSPKPRTHVISAGETYSRISTAAYGTPIYFNAIQRANPTVDPHRLKIGTTITLPDIAEIKGPAAAPDAVAGGTAPARAGTRPEALAAVQIDPSKEYRVQSGDSLHKISIRLYGNLSMVDKIYELNKDAIGPDKARLKLHQTLKLPGPPTTVTH